MPRNDPLSRISTTQTPQTQPIPGRDMIRNDAGGYVFDKDVARKVEDFLILGVTGGTYYIGKDDLAAKNIDWLIHAIRADGLAVVKLIEDVSTSKPPRAPKPRPAIFALAAIFAFGDADAVQAAKAIFNRVVRTTDHLSQFFGYAKQLRGRSSPQGTSLVTGRAIRSALGSWFYSGDANRASYKACKARQRKTPTGEALNLRDVLRVSHPKFDTEERRLLFGWLAGNVGDKTARARLQPVDDFLTAQAVKSTRDAVKLVSERSIPWEFLPSEFTGKKEVWEALAPSVGITALIRNLAHMTSLGAIAPFSKTTDVVTRRLRNAELLKNGRVHPLDLYLALKVYQSGRAQPSPKAPVRTWHPVDSIVDALEDAYETSFGYIEPSGQRQLIAVDSSGSMGFQGVNLGGSSLGTIYSVACAMALILKRIEGSSVHLIDIDTTIHQSRITARTNLREIERWSPSGGGTDLSLAASYALRKQLVVDGITILSDMETWAGRSHYTQELLSYRNKINRNVKVVAVAMTPRGYTITDPATPGVLQVAGFDATLPKVVTAFLR